MSFIAAHPLFFFAAVGLISYPVIGYLIARLSWWTWWNPRSAGTPLRPLLFPYTWLAYCDSGTAKPPFGAHDAESFDLRIAAGPRTRKRWEEYRVRMLFLWPIKLACNTFGQVAAVIVSCYLLLQWSGKGVASVLERIAGRPDLLEEEPKAETTAVPPPVEPPHPVDEHAKLQQEIAALDSKIAESTAARDALVAKHAALVNDPDKGKIIALHGERPVA